MLFLRMSARTFLVVMFAVLGGACSTRSSLHERVDAGEPCDPIAPAKVCGAGTCTVDIDETVFCASAGSVVAGGACTSDPHVCAPGFYCIAGTCNHWCRLTVAADCPAPTTCNATSPPFRHAGVDYGFCR